MANEIIHKQAEITSPEAGIIHAWLSRYGNVDDQNDIVLPGAFGDWLEANGDKPVPILKGHNLSEFPLGHWRDFEETPAGLKAIGVLAMDENPEAQTAAALMRRGLVNGVSVGFKLLEGKATRRLDGKFGRDISKAWLMEASITPRPSNPEAVITALDDEDVKAIFKGGDASEIVAAGCAKLEAEYWAAVLVRAVARREGLAL